MAGAAGRCRTKVVVLRSCSPLELNESLSFASPILQLSTCHYLGKAELGEKSWT